LKKSVKLVENEKRNINYQTLKWREKILVKGGTKYGLEIKRFWLPGSCAIAITLEESRVSYQGW